MHEMGGKMAKGEKRRGRPPNDKPRAVRVTVGLPPDTYETLRALAKHKKVSTAWIVRDAAEKYIADHWPLFGKEP